MSRLSVVAALLVACAPKAAPDVAAKPADPFAAEAPLPFDPGVRTGVLDNGLRWYVEHNPTPKDRAVLRLVVDAGSILEDEDQLGLAHFVEHMAFNGSENFPGNSLITTLEGLGTRFGPHINAHTSFDETVYKLQVPSNQPETLDTAFQILDDWAGGLSFTDEEIEKERGVVLEEWRRSLGPGMRNFKKLMPLTFHGSPYPDRLPIGTEQSLKSFTPEAARRFYADWYRPDLMSVIVVGDIDVDAVQAKIEHHFGDLQTPDQPRQRRRPPITDHDETLAVVVTDPETPRASVQVMHTRDMVEGTTHGEYRQDIVGQMAQSIVNERLQALSMSADPPFLYAGVGEQRLTPVEGAWSLGVGTTEDGTLAGLEAAWTEVVRAKRHGFSEAEVERARKRILASFDQYEAEAKTTESSDGAAELIRHVTTNEPVPGVAYEVAMVRAWMPQITPTEVSAWAADWMPDDSRSVAATLPDKEGLTPPTPEALVAVLDEVDGSEIAPPAAETAVAGPVPEPPTPGTVVQTHNQYEADLGFTGWTLSNGATVWFKKTDFKRDEIQFSAWSPGGISRVAATDHMTAVLANQVLGASGAGALSATDMQRWMAGRTFQTSMWLGNEGESISGSSTADDLGDALSVMWSEMTQPRLTDDALQLVMANQRVQLQNRSSQPSYQFYEALNKATWPHSPLMQMPTIEQLEAAADLEAMQQIMGDRFARTSDFTFFFVGNLPDDFQTQVTTWIGGLPATEGTETVQDSDLARKSGPVDLTVRAGTDPKATVHLEWVAPDLPNERLFRNRQHAVRQILATLLREELREARGGVYTVGGHSIMRAWPTLEADTTISFSCDPDRVDELVEATISIVEKLRTKPVDARYVQEHQAKGRTLREENLRTNSFWLSGMRRAIELGEDPRDLVTWDARNDSLSPEVVQAAAAMLFPTSKPTIKAVLLPEEG